MMPILFRGTETEFSTNGVGVLSDAISCVVTEERNGIYELELIYPIDGIHYADLALRSFILAVPNKQDRPQPFRVYDISQPFNGIVTFYAQHISYDLNGIPVRPFSAASAPHAMTAIVDNAVTPCPFVFETDKQVQTAFAVYYPSSIRSILGGTEGSLLDVYGGEYHFDRYAVQLQTARGKDNGVSLRYGKNLTNVQQDKNCEGVYTGVYPYWAGSDGAYVELDSKVVEAQGDYDFSRILPLDFSSDFDTAPTQEQLHARAVRYIEDNKIGIPSVSITASFVDLTQTEEYKDIAPLEAVALCDTVSVYFARLGVSATAKVIKTVYDCLLDRYVSLDIGDARSNLAQTIANQNAAIYSMPQKVVDGLTSTEIFYKLTDHGRIQGIYIQDNKWYINAEVAQIVNLIADQVKSSAGKSTVQITGAVLEMLVDGKQRIGIFNDSSDTPTLRILAADGSNNGLQLTAKTLNLGDIEVIAEEYPLTPYLYEDKTAGTALLHQLGANQLMTAKLLINGDGAGLYTADDGKVELRFDRIIPTGAGNCAWVYSSELQRNVLVQI